MELAAAVLQADLAKAQHSKDVRANWPESLYEYMAGTVRGIAQNASAVTAIKVRFTFKAANLRLHCGQILKHHCSCST